MRIQHNIMAMSAYRNYTNNVSAMKKNLEKLSSGYKINRAGDDAAGLAISEKMRAQITGLETAQKNAKDGISLVQTAEGALTEVHDMLNRMVELATQSANGTYDNTTDRAQMQKELDQLRSEINRIADSSNFNGIKLFDGSMEANTSEYKLTGDAALDILNTAGANFAKAGVSTVLHTNSKEANATSFEVELENVAFASVGAGGTKVGIEIKVGSSTAKVSVNIEKGGLSGANLASKLAATGSSKVKIGGVTYGMKAEGSKIVFTMTEDSLKNVTKAASFNGNFEVKTAVANATTGKQESGTINLGAQVIKEGNPKMVGNLANTTTTNAVTDAFFKDGNALTVGDTTYVFTSTDATKEAVEAAAKAGNKFVAVDLSKISTDGELDDAKAAALGYDTALNAAGSMLTEAAKDNAMFTVGFDTANKLTFQEKTSYNGDGQDGRADLTSLDGIKAQLRTGTFEEVVHKADKGTGKGLVLQIGDTADDFNQLKVSLGDMHCKSLFLDKDGTKTSLADISIADQDKAAVAVDVIKAAINQVSDVRGTLGATQNRLDHTINNLSVMTENIQDAESTIRDVDIAEEMMAYTKNNILIQSAQAMLAQANQVPQGVLQLLQ